MSATGFCTTSGTSRTTVFTPSPSVTTSGPAMPFWPGMNCKLPTSARKLESLATVPVSLTPEAVACTATPKRVASAAETPKAPWVTSNCTDTGGVLSPATGVLSRSASYSEPAGKVSGVASSPATISVSGRRRLSAADAEGAAKRKMAWFSAKAVTMPVVPSMVAPTQSLPLLTPISPRPAACTQLAPRSLDIQTPPFLPEAVATSAVPSALMATRVPCPSVPTWVHFQLA